MESQLTSKTGASFHRGSSKQDYATPSDFRTAVVKKFGFPAWDLAAAEWNHFGPVGNFFDAQNSAFLHDWHKMTGLLWLNPPFCDIEPWAKKCHEEYQKGAWILLLVPASVGSVWFQTHVHAVAHTVHFLSPRLCFDGKAPFPKDCILADYRDPHNTRATVYAPWRWK